MLFSNQAAYLDGKNQELRVGPADMPTAGEGEIVIRNRAVAVNPVSCKVQETGFLAKEWPVILDYDIAGEAHEIGPGMERFMKGDRVVAFSSHVFDGGPKYGAWQEFVVAKNNRIAKIPDDISFAEASVLPTCFSTAIVALCAGSGKGFGLPLPSLTPTPSGQTIVIWGASSSVGLQTLQLARAAGVKTIATASPRNFDLVTSAGASHVLDYRSASIVDDLIALVKEVEVEFVGVIDCISEAGQSLDYCVAVLKGVGGGKLGVVKPHLEIDVPVNIELIRIFGLSELTNAFWNTFLTPALQSGALKCLPKPLIVGNGLGFLQEAMDTLRRGVSATKVVVTLEGN